MLPATLWMSLLSALIFMTAIYTGAAFGVAIPAILMGVPGSPAAVATSFDGYPMTQRGEHNLALGLALAASTLGHMGAYLILFLFIGVISHAVLKLGPLEMLLLMLWGLTLIAALRGRYVSRSLLSGLLGILIATIGLSPRDVIRGTFDMPELLDGVPVVSAMIGLFAASELFNLAGTSYLVQRSDLRTVSVRDIARGMLQALQHPIVILRGLLIGATIGGLPGVGAAVCNLVSYAETRRGDKHPESFGKGNPKGVIAAEAGNASSEAGSMATLLALGIPGGASSAVMLAALSLHDVTSGPQFLDASKDIVYAIILNNFVQGAIMLVLGLGLIGMMANVIRIPVRVLIPVILVLATFGSYGLSGNMAGPATMVVFGLLGWFMQRHDYSVPACVVGLIFGGKVETPCCKPIRSRAAGSSAILPAGRSLWCCWCCCCRHCLAARSCSGGARASQRSAKRRKTMPSSRCEEMAMARTTENSAKKITTARRIARRPFLGMLAGAAAAGNFAARKAAAATWPDEPITIVVSTKAGGGFDMMARNLAPALSKELGVPVNVLDKEGGAMVIGTRYFLSQPHDGNTLLVSGPAPYWYADINKFHAGYDLKDFDILNVQWTDKTGVFVPKGGKYQSFKDIIEAIKAHPGDVSCGVVRDSGEFFNAGILMSALKLPLSAIRLVTYEASAPLRTAVAGEQLDFALVSLEASLTMLSLITAVAIFNDVPIPELPGTPTAADILKSEGITATFVPSSMRALIIHADLKEKYPDRYERLRSTYEKILHDPDFLAKAKKQGVGTDWLGPEQSLAQIKSAYAIFDQYKSLLNQ